MAEENNEQTPDGLFLVDESTKEFFETYVGPGKKYPNVGELAKAYANADNHIHELTTDAGKYKTEAESLKELLMENLVNPNKPDESNPNPNPNDAAPAPNPADAAPPKEDEIDVKALVKEALAEVSQEDVRKENARVTEEATVKKFGSKEDAVKAIEAKAAELGLSSQWIANLAFESPKAYFVTMGFEPDETPKSNSTPASKSEVNPQMLEQTNPGVAKPNSYRWFMDMRKTDPVRFRSVAIQSQMMKAAQENPDFYK